MLTALVDARNLKKKLRPFCSRERLRKSRSPTFAPTVKSGPVWGSTVACWWARNALKGRLHHVSGPCPGTPASALAPAAARREYRRITSPARQLSLPPVVGRRRTARPCQLEDLGAILDLQHVGMWQGRRVRGWRSECRPPPLFQHAGHR